MNHHAQTQASSHQEASAQKAKEAADEGVKQAKETGQNIKDTAASAAENVTLITHLYLHFKLYTYIYMSVLYVCLIFL